MLQGYYQLKAKYYSEEMEKFNQKNLNNLENFNDAVKKYNKFKIIYNKAKYYISKNSDSYIDDENVLDFQIKNNLDILYNKCIDKALKSNDENLSFIELEKIKTDLNNSYGYGFDDYISEYHQALYNIIENHKVIYKNYNNSLKRNPSINIDNTRDPLYNEIVEFIIETGKVSASLLQRRFKFGYNRAVHVIEQLEDEGLIGPQKGNEPRNVLINRSDNGNFNSKSFIDYANLYGNDYESIEKEKRMKIQKEQEKIDNFNKNYNDMAQSYFDAKGLNIIFNKNKRLNTNKLNNVLFTNTSSEDVERLVNSILCTSVPNELKLILIDYSQINLFDYNGLSNLLVPVISDYQTAKIALDNLKNEMNNRYKLFLNSKVKNIISYNNAFDTKLPYIVVVINEIFEMLRFENTREIMLEVLLNCKQVGIILMCFSKLNKKNIQLVMLEDLFEVHNGYTNGYLESDDTVCHFEINNVDSAMNGFDFEKYTGELLKSNGFTNVEVTQCSNDFGVDVIAYKDEIKYAIQCKKYSSPVGIKAVQEVIGSKSMNNCHVAVVLTNNIFTKSAKELAEKNNVLLWDRYKLIELIHNMNK